MLWGFPESTAFRSYVYNMSEEANMLIFQLYPLSVLLCFPYMMHGKSPEVIE